MVSDKRCLYLFLFGVSLLAGLFLLDELGLVSGLVAYVYSMAKSLFFVRVKFVLLCLSIRIR